jgi:hypothetical protein
MKLMRRWLAYRRIVVELSAVPTDALGEIGPTRNSIRDFAWHCAAIETERQAAELEPAMHSSARRVRTGAA